MKHLFLAALTILIIYSCIKEPNEPSSEDQIVLLISLDGFRHDYFDFAQTPTLDKLISEGAKADGLVPVFPTKTFPNHYTQVTGLYPEHHGITSNSMYDSTFQEFFSIGASSTSAREGKWYEGEPVWVTAKKNGLKSACYFWPGSEAEIGGYRPDIYEVFSDTVSHATRVNGVLDWLNMDADSRPRFITLYFSKVDSEGHWKGPVSSELKDEIEDIDASLETLIQGIEDQGKTNLVNLMIVSDHGMAQLSRDSCIFLDDYIDVFDDVTILNYTPVVDLFPNDGKFDQVYQALKDVHPKLTIYKKDEIPADLHYKNHRRIAPIMGYAENEWSITTRDYWNASQTRFTGGTHGYHESHRDMHGIFIGRGPAFKVGYSGAPISNIHLYEMMCEILEIPPANNDGNLDVARPFLKN